MSNKVMLGVLALVGLLFIGTLLLRTMMPVQSNPPGSSPDAPISIDMLPPAGAVTLLGEAVCLPHKGNPEITTMECAYGFKDIDGFYYGIRDMSSDLHTITQIEMGAPLRITGTFYPQEDAKYASVGIIEVSKIERAEVVEPMSIVVTGTFVCLPHKDTTGPQTEECAFGIKTDEGIHYAVNFGASATMAEQFHAGVRGTYTGILTPKEMLSTNHWEKYTMEGIFTITEVGE